MVFPTSDLTCKKKWVGLDQVTALTAFRPTCTVRLSIVSELTEITKPVVLKLSWAVALSRWAVEPLSRYEPFKRLLIYRDTWIMQYHDKAT